MASRVSRIVAQGLTVPGNDLALAVADKSQNDLLSVALIQEGQSLAQWLIEVRAVTAQGMVDVGAILAQGPPFIGPPSDPLSRLVAMAYYPGVKEWVVSARADINADGTQDAADIILTSSECCAGFGFPGVFAVRHGGGNENGSRFFFDVPPTATTLVQANPFGGQPQQTIRRARGTVTSAAAIVGNLTIMLFDKASAPVAADAIRQEKAPAVALPT